MPSRIDIPRDFEEFFALLNKNEVRYLVIGGYAFAIHAHPRFTDDIDVFIATTKTNAKKLMKALDEFGFGNVGLTVEDLLRPDYVIQLGYPPLRIDLLTSISRVSFSEAWKRRVHVRFGKQRVWFISKRDLIESKKGTGRKKDRRDLDELL